MTIDLNLLILLAFSIMTANSSSDYKTFQNIQWLADQQKELNLSFVQTAFWIKPNKHTNEAAREPSKFLGWIQNTVKDFCFHFMFLEII